MPAFVYMLQCADNSFYVGSTRGESMEARIGQHQLGEIDGYTSRRRPVTLVWSQEFERITDAIAAERQVKGWSRAKKTALMNGEWDRLRLLSKRRGGTGLNPRPSRAASPPPQDED